MAHRSKKKHLKHLHEHEPATPRAKSPVVKAEAAAAGIAKKGGRARRAPELKGAPKRKQKGIVRRLAAKAAKKITAKPRKIIKRVKSMLGREEK